MKKDAEGYIYEYFEDIKRQVDLRKEELNLNIETHASEIIQSVETAKAKCLKQYKDVDFNPHGIDIEYNKRMLDYWIEEFDSFLIIDRYEEIYLLEFCCLSQTMLDKYKNSITGDGMYSFNHVKTPIGDSFGRFINYNKKCKNKIIVFSLFSMSKISS